MVRRHLVALPVLIAVLSILAGCASSTPPATVIRTLYDPDQDGFRNVLVISVAGDYRTRESFERQLVQQISDGNVTASAYYTVIGRNPQFNRAYIDDAIRSRKFDGLIFTRIKGQEQEELAPGRPVGPGFDLFGYDYAELNRDVAIREARAITFVTEVYDTITQSKVWSIDTLSTEISTLENLIAQQAGTVAAQLRQDRMLRR